MYLYFGKDGKLKTKINHDAPPRQGGDLNVTVCLDMDFWDDKEKWGVDGDKYWVKTARIKLASGVLGYPQIATEGQIEVFSKLYNSEIVYDLVPGASYLMYKFRFSAEEVTKIPGQINFELSMQNLSFSDNKYVRIGTRSEFIKMVENPGNGENCISRELNNLTGEISSVVYKKGNGTQAFSDLSPVSANKYQVGTYQARIEKSLTNNDEGFVFVQQDKNPDEYTYGEVSIWMWAKATGAATTCEWIQLPQYSTTDIIPTDGTFAFGVTDITIERTVGYARALIDKEIGIKYQDIMDEFKRVYSKIAIAGTKPDWNVGENTSPSYIYNKPNIKTVPIMDVHLIRETGVYIVKNSPIDPYPIPGDYVLLHYADSQGKHIQLIFENQNITWFRSIPQDNTEFGDWEKREIREVLHPGGAPNSSTPGIVGQFFVDSISDLYYCVSAINNVYTWERLVNLTYFESEKKSITDQIDALKNADEAINGQIENLETSINNLSSDITTITSGLNKKFDNTGGTISGDVNVTGFVKSNGNISTDKNISADGSIEGKNLTVRNDAVITGNATIGGSLTVTGAVTSVETTNVSIKDQLFEIAKGEKGDVGLNSPAGFYVSNYDGQGNNLAIVFDSTGTAYVGDVSIGENGLISDTSHLQPFATRQKTEIKDKSILQWDQQSNSLKDSGKTIDDFVEKQENNTGYNCLYGQDVNNNVELVRMSQNKDDNTVPLRTEGGRLKGGQAKENDEFVTLQQLNDSESKLSEQVDFLEDKINETIAVNPGKTYILIIGDSVTFTVRNDGVYSVDMGDGTIYSNISNVTKTHNYTRKGSAHIITVSGVGTNGDFGFSLGEDQNLAFRSIHFGEGIKKITNFLVSTPVDVCVLPKTITEVLSDNFTDGNATLKYAKSVYCLSETPFTISKNVFANSLRIFVKRDSLDQYKQAWYQHLPASIIVSEVDSSDLVNEIVQTTGQSTTAVMSQKATTDEIATLKGYIGYLRTHSKNIFDGDIVQGNISNSSGADSDSTKEYFVRTDSYIPIDANVKVSGSPYYYFSLKCPMDTFYLYQYNSDKELIKSENAGIGLSNERKGFWKIIESNCSYVRFKIYHSDGATKCTPSDVSLVQIESGYEMTDYVYPYVAFDQVARNQSTTNKADIATNKADIATNKVDIAEHTSSLSAYGLDLVNLIDINTLTHGGYYTDTWNTAYGYSATDYIEVEEETDYCFQCFSTSTKKWAYGHPIVAYYNADKTYISWTNKATSDNYYTTPKNAKYCRVSYNTGLFGNMMMFKGHIPVLNHYIQNSFDLINQYFPWNLACGEIACIGDSLTAGLYAPISVGEILQGYPYYLRRILNANVTVCAKSGGYPSAFYNGETGYTAYDFSKFDTIILWLGTNGGMSINDIDTDGTEANYYKKIIEGIKSQKSDIQIFLGRVFVTGPKGSETTYPTATQTNEVIDYFANLYSIPTIDFSDLTYLKYPHLHNYQENTHFGKLGNIYIANRIANFMQNYFEDVITRVEFGLLPKTSN